MSNFVSPSEKDAGSIVSNIQKKIKMQKDRAPDPKSFQNLNRVAVFLVFILGLLILLLISKLIVTGNSLQIPLNVKILFTDPIASNIEALTWLFAGVLIVVLLKLSSGVRNAAQKAITYVRSTHSELTYLEEYVESMNADLHLAQEAAEWTAEKHGAFSIHLKKMEKEFIPALAEAKQRLEELDVQIGKEKTQRKQQMTRQKNALNKKIDEEVLPLIEKAQGRLEELKAQVRKESETRQHEDSNLAESLKKKFNEEIDQAIDVHNKNLQQAIGFASGLTKIDRSTNPEEQVRDKEKENENEGMQGGVSSN